MRTVRPLKANSVGSLAEGASDPQGGKLWEDFPPFYRSDSNDKDAAQDPEGVGEGVSCRKVIVLRVYFFGSTVSFIALPTRNFSVVFAGI
jgi:hypothetical protein